MNAAWSPPDAPPMPPRRPDPIARVAGGLAALCVLVAAAIVIGGDPAAPDPLVDRTSYSAGVRHALDHQANPLPSGYLANRDGTQAECRVWFDQVVRAWDRDDFLAGCADVAMGR